MTEIKEESKENHSHDSLVFNRKNLVDVKMKKIKNNLALYSTFKARQQFIPLKGNQDHETMKTVLDD